MFPDLERLIRLQHLDTFIDNARRRIADHPALVQGLDAKLQAANDAVAAAKQHVADNRAARAAVEKDLSAVQSRLSKFRDQLMEVKTNKEYQAMQKEIEVAQTDVRRLEDRILERMLEADDLGAALKKAEAALVQDKSAIDDERKALEQETQQLRKELDDRLGERETLVPSVSAQLLAIYDSLIRNRRGLAVVEARDYLCTACHMEMRPQVFNEIRRGDVIHQCGSCQRILYYAHPASAPAAADAPDADAGSREPQ